MHCSVAVADPTVIAAVPFVPPGIAFAFAARHRAVPRKRHEGIDVHHPRVPVGPGMTLHSVEASISYPFIRRVADALHREGRFSLVHAHFIYPDGVIATELGRRYGIPVVTTEPAPWLPWLDAYPRVRRQVEQALPGISKVMVVSEFLRANVRSAVGDRAVTVVVPNVVDNVTFRGPEPGEERDPDQLLFVGLIRRVKGLDVLVRAMALLAASRPTLRLLVLGVGFYRDYQREEQEVRGLAQTLGLGSRVHFAGQTAPGAVAAAMRRSALLVVPSRRETFSVVTVEALASGIPVVATRCGGPEEMLTSSSASWWRRKTRRRSPGRSKRRWGGFRPSTAPGSGKGRFPVTVGRQSPGDSPRSTQRSYPRLPDRARSNPTSSRSHAPAAGRRRLP